MSDSTSPLPHENGGSFLGLARHEIDSNDAERATSPFVAVIGAGGNARPIVAATLESIGLRPFHVLVEHGSPRRRVARTTVYELETEVLATLGGSSTRPPLLVEGWENDEGLARSYERAFDLVKELDRTEEPSIVFSSERLGMLLPFWLKVLRRPVVAVLVLDPPIEAAHALVEREGLSLAHGLALYERYLRSTIASLVGRPVFVSIEDGAHERRSPETIVSFLREERILLPQRSTGRVASDIEAFARRESATHVDDEHLVLSSTTLLYEAIRAARGPHSELVNIGSSAESPWVTEVLESARDLEQSLSGLHWATRQLETALRARPRVVAKEVRVRSSDQEEEIRLKELSDDGPYPLNASEDRHAYHRWLSRNHEPVIVGGPGDPPRTKPTRRARLFRRRPFISIIVPVYKSPIWVLERCIGSVLGQTYRDWELCICDDASSDEELDAYLRTARRLDRRIKVTALRTNGGISAATNKAMSLASGRFVAFLDHDDELRPRALEIVATAIEKTPTADVLYSDEDKIDALGERFDPLFKPDWSPDLLMSFAYLCHLTVIRRSLVDEIGGLRSEFDGSQDYDLSLRATERARDVVHISEILYHWRTLPGSAATDSPNAIAKPWAYAAGRRAIEETLKRRGEQGEVTTVPGFPGRYHVRRKVTERPLVSIIIPFRDEPALLGICTSSLRANPGYDNIELVLVDNESELPETHALLDRLTAEDNVRLVRSPGPFNWAAINNAAVRHARGEVLLFANNDIEAHVPRWLDGLLGHALRPEVGAVGARLVYPDGLIQHAGVVIGLGGVAGHVLRGLPGDHPGYNSMAIQTRNCSVVTGACMMTRRDVFESVGGFDESLPVAFNDVDYCLKLRDKGFLVVYTPLAELVHHESKSRGHTDDLSEQKRIVSRWADKLVEGDPYLNTHLSHWRYWCPLSTEQEEDRWRTYLETSVLTPESSSNT